MKINIITVFGSYNHGSYLQANSLFKLLCQYGDTSLIDLRTRKWSVLRTSFRRTKLFVKKSGKYTRIIHIMLYELKEAIITKNLWKKTKNSDNREADVYVLGSDEIWNIKRAACRYPEFWGCGFKGKKISYAPSINNACEKDFEKEPQYIQYLNDIDYLSVRDNRSQEVLANYTDKKIDIVLDPTLLFDPEEIEFKNEREYIAVYTFIGQITEDEQKKIIKFARENNLDLIATGQTVTWCDKCVHSKNGNPFYIYKNAKYVVTSTFHGTAYAINYRKNFVAFTKENSKIQELLNQFDLQNRSADSGFSIEQIFDAEIDVAALEQKLNDYRKASFDYLHNALVVLKKEEQYTDDGI